MISRLPLPFRLLHLLARFHRCRRAVVAVEMALVAPVLIALLLGTLDLGWRVLAAYKLERAVAALADLSARSRDLSADDLADIFAAVVPIAEPFALEEGTVIVSGVRDDTGTRPVIVWQQRSGPEEGDASRIGSEGEVADLDGMLDLEAGESVIVAELVFRFEPLVGFLLRQPQELYFRWLARPRSGTVTELD